MIETHINAPENMIITYRPELENPPMAKECSLGFSFLPKSDKERTVKHVRIQSGVTRNFEEGVWEAIENYDVVKRLVSLGALVVTQEVDVEATVINDEPGTETLKDVALNDALGLIEASFDLDQLKKWLAKDQRIRVRNAVNKRITAITEGNA